jgi:predicted amidophosphoribosyltransferase
MLCGRPTYDPSKKERPWSRGVSAGQQVLVCPNCQAERPGWTDSLERCERCGSTRLSAMLGEVVCRQCGLVAGTLEPEEPLIE